MRRSCSRNRAMGNNRRGRIFSENEISAEIRRRRGVGGGQKEKKGENGCSGQRERERERERHGLCSLIGLPNGEIWRARAMAISLAGRVDIFIFSKIARPSFDFAAGRD